MSNTPQIKENIDWTPVIQCVSDYMERLFNDEGVHDDEDHYIYEEVVAAMYGKDVWDKIREQYNKRDC